jgi:hypothetical protein
MKQEKKEREVSMLLPQHAFSLLRHHSLAVLGLEHRVCACLAGALTLEPYS